MNMNTALGDTTMKTRTTLIYALPAMLALCVLRSAWQDNVAASASTISAVSLAPAYDADLRPFMFVTALSNKAKTADNPLGLAGQWVNGDVGWLLERMNDGGLDRVVFRQPAGNKTGPGESVSFSNWHTLTDVQRAAMETAIRTWKSAKPNRTVGVFIYVDPNDPFHMSAVGTGQRALNLTDRTAVRWWQQNTDPWRAIGVDEFWLDSGSLNGKPIEQWGVTYFAWNARYNHGIKIGIEAIAFKNGDPAQGPDWDYGRSVPMMAMWRLVWRHGLRHPMRHEGWTVPDGWEMHVVMEHGRGSEWPEPTAADVAKLQEIGWIISWAHTTWEVQ